MRAIPTLLLFSLLGISIFHPHQMAGANSLPKPLSQVIENHCLDCHDDLSEEGGLDFLSLDWNLADEHTTSVWVKVHDQLASGEMPPPKKSTLDAEGRRRAIDALAAQLTQAQEEVTSKHGRTVSRRVNRFEFENILRDLLHDPHLKIASLLPLDGEVHGFAKVGTALDVSHVQVEAYLDAAE
ncbi:MAG: DUF1587 domain-containing protein, partial [Verrucomicrobiota bacterium]